jgi:hypothetical protein
MSRGAAIGAAAIAALAALGAWGCGDDDDGSGGSGSGQLAKLSAAPVPFAGRLPAPYGIAPLGDVDGDGRGDAEVVTARGSWLVTSRGKGAVVALRHLAPMVSKPTAGVEAIGDADGDGRDDLAVASDRAALVVLYGRDRWPATVDLRSAAGAQAGAVVGTAATGAPFDAAARDGATLLVPPICDGSCPRGSAFRVAVPARRRTVSLAGAPRQAGPATADGERNLGAEGPWASGRRAMTAWTIEQHESSHPTVPVLSSGDGATSWRLGRGEVLEGLTTAGAALASTRSEAPPGEAVQAHLSFYRLGADGRTRSFALTPSYDADAVTGSLTAAGRCLLASGTQGAGEPTMAWAIDPSKLKVLTRWAFPTGTFVTAQPARDVIDFVVVDAHGRLTRARAPLPPAC